MPPADPPHECPFCDVPPESIYAMSEHAFAIRDNYPVARGHMLVIPNIHAASIFAHNASVQADVWHLVANVRADLQSQLNPDGFSVGLNDGQAAGQTVHHAHVHIIPRFHGDVDDPRGGIRWLLPKHAAYWDP